MPRAGTPARGSCQGRTRIGQRMSLTRRELIKATAAALAAGAAPGALAASPPAQATPVTGGAAPVAAGGTATGATSVAARPLQLWYPRPATRWVEALPLGNG